MAQSKKTTAAKRSTTSSRAKKTPADSKKISCTFSKELLALLDEYIAQTGQSRDSFIQKAVYEKISREKISGMIDDLIRQ